MPISISCRELGINCHFVCEGETETAVMESFVSHLQEDHDGEWFEIEELYETARVVVRSKAA